MGSLGSSRDHPTTKTKPILRYWAVRCTMSSPPYSWQEEKYEILLRFVCSLLFFFILRLSSFISTKWNKQMMFSCAHCAFNTHEMCVCTRAFAIEFAAWLKDPMGWVLWPDHFKSRTTHYFLLWFRFRFFTSKYDVLCNLLFFFMHRVEHFGFVGCCGDPLWFTFVETRMK